jgi:hypothetical protein
MQAITTIGLDIAKSIFQVHGLDAQGNVVFRRQLKRRYVLPFFQKLPPCLVLRLDIGGLDHFRPLLCFPGNELAEFGSRDDKSRGAQLS